MICMHMVCICKCIMWSHRPSELDTVPGWCGQCSIWSRRTVVACAMHRFVYIIHRHRLPIWGSPWQCVTTTTSSESACNPFGKKKHMIQSFTQKHAWNCTALLHCLFNLRLLDLSEQRTNAPAFAIARPTSNCCISSRRAFKIVLMHYNCERFVSGAMMNAF